MGFNLKDYETVKSRKRRFYEQYPDGRIIADCIRSDSGEALFKASIYKTRDDQEAGLPLATGYAQEQKGIGSPANRVSWTENCEESAIGRALDNGGFSGDLKCSREEINKVQRMLDEEDVNPQIDEKTSLIHKIGKIAKEKGYTSTELKQISWMFFKRTKSIDLNIEQLKTFINSLDEEIKENLVKLANVGPEEIEPPPYIDPDSIPNYAPGATS